MLDAPFAVLAVDGSSNIFVGIEWNVPTFACDIILNGACGINQQITKGLITAELIDVVATADILAASPKRIDIELESIRLGSAEKHRSEAAIADR